MALANFCPVHPLVNLSIHSSIHPSIHPCVTLLFPWSVSFRPIQHGTLHAASELTGQQTVGFMALANFGCTGLERNLDECPRPVVHDIPAVNCPTGAAAIACQGEALSFVLLPLRERGRERETERERERNREK